MSLKNVEDLYPLSPMQQGMLFHSLYAPESGVYFEQMSCILRGDLDVSAFEQAWQRMMERHLVLRTAFVGEGLKEPIQVVHRQVKLPLEQQDWQGLSSAEQSARLEAFLQAERCRGFVLSEPPLMRLALIRMSKDAYQFVWCHHHLLLDGWCVPMLLQEVLAFYEAFRISHDLSLEPPRPYRDYIVWLKKQDLSKAEAFWRQTLKGFTAPTPLVVGWDPKSMLDQSESYAELERWLSAETTAKLQTLARQHQLTLSTLVQGAWGLLLSRYGGEQDVLFGATVSGRPPDLAGSESMIGLFINTLPVRMRVKPEATVAAWLKELQAQLVEMRQYEYSPLVEIQGWSEVPRGLSLFESLLVFENYPVATVLREQEGSLRVENIRSAEYTNYPLTVVAGAAQELMLKIIYDCRRFDAETIRRMLGHLGKLLEGIAVDPERQVSTLPLLTEAERQQLLVAWNATDMGYPKDRCAHELFEAQVKQIPDAMAVTFESETLTYQELNRRANQLAHYLQRLGVGPEVLVGICMERSLELVVGALGVLKAGGAYVPMDTSYPKERLAFMLEDTRSPVLLTQARLVERLPACQARLVCLDADWGAIAQEPDENPVSGSGLGNLAYVIYTSGSTGKPKGVQIEHNGLLNLIFWHRRAFGISQTDRATMIAGLGFDASVWELWPYLTAGASIHIPNEETRISLSQLTDWLASKAITITFLPTPLAEGALMLDWPADSALRTLLTGGDKLHYYPPHSLPFELVNNYGPTEDTVVTTSGVITPQQKGDTAPSIGRPIANTQVYLLDTHLQPVPIGVPGELHVGGAGLARGYLNRLDLTAERFIADPFSREPGALLYRTGDLARYLPDGAIEFLGRIDHQVKIRGFRIELGEIEMVLGEYPAVREAIVLAREDEPEDKRLVAYVVPDEEHPPSAGELHAFLQQKLPAYMVPSAFVMLDALPLTPNGKVDRGALPLADGSHVEIHRKYIAPRTPVEEMLCAIWSQVLGIERVGIYDNFFELGGHSLLATQAISRVRKAFQVEVPLRDLFETATVAGLAERVDMARQAAAGLDVSPIEPVTRNQELPLSFAQQRLWFLDQLEPYSPLYNIPAATRFSGPLDIAALEWSLNEIVRRHESLRTTFQTIDGRPAQVISPELTLTLPVMDLASLPAVEREAEALRLATDEARQPFDLAHGPLMRTTLLRLDEQEYVILLTMHHIVSDGWSMGVFVQEMVALYSAFVAGKSSPLPELAIQYADFAHWQRQWLQGQALEAQLAYWEQQLAGLAPLLELPFDRPRPVIQSFNGNTLSFTLPQRLSKALKALSQHEGVTLFMTLLAAFQTLLSRYTSQEDICVGTPIANRNRAEIEGLIGFFVNTLVLRTDLSGGPSFRELLKRVRQVTLDAYAHQDLPFEMLVDALQPKRDMSYSPLFQVMFVLQNVPMQNLELPGLTLGPVEADSKIAKFDLTLSMLEDAGGLSGSFEYNVDLFDAATIQRMAGHLQRLLEGIVADPDQSITNLPLLTGAEHRQLLVEWNDTDTEYPHDQCAHQLFETQVRRAPDAIAVMFEEERLTYAELDRRTNQLARHLQKLGVQPDTLVGICMERSIEMIVGLLGVLKAGGAYVPMDPDYPQERLTFVLEDTQMRVVLTQQRLTSSLPKHGIKVVCLDTDWDIIAQECGENPVSNVTPENLAYVIYTSGSTGKPKGVLITHQNLVHSTYARMVCHPTPISRFLLLSSFAFDSSVPGLFGTLCEGGMLVLPPQGGEQDLLHLIDLIARHRITDTVCLPALYGLLLAQAQPERMASLRRVIWGGETPLHEIVEHHRQMLPETALFNEYGPTEGTVWCSVYEIRLDEPGTCVPIGRSIANTQIYLLDSHLQPVPVGVPGELHIGGTGVARGYLNRPELTAAKFIPNPFSSAPEARLYKTGDLARYLPDGNIEFLGRIDQQVKVRGFRIELGEIETALGQHPALQEVAVLARDDTPGDKHLVAYLVPRQEPAPSIAELRSFVRARLPEYMVPSAFVVLKEMPLMPNGKIDRRALPAPEQTRPELENAYVAPRTRAEEILAGIWAQVLGVERVGIRDSFFELGGDSILSIQVIARANQQGLRLTPKQLFQSPTVEGLAAAVGTAAIIQAEQGIVTGPMPLIPVQHWFFEHHPVDPHHWNTSMLIAVWQPLDMAVLEQTLKHLLIHHDALRLRFHKAESGWQQFNADTGDTLPFSRLDLSSVAPEEQAQAIESAAAALQGSLNLSEGPLLQMVYFDLGPAQPDRLLMIFHHLVLDGVSWRVFLEDLQTVYHQLSRGERVQLPPKTTSFQYWSRRLKEYAESPQLRQELDYWLKITAQEARPLPVDYRDGANTYGSVDNVTVSLCADETQALLHKVPAAYGTQINDVLLTALVRAFARWTGERALLVEMEGHGREHILEDVDLSRTVGWFTTSFPVRLELGPDDEPETALQTIKAQSREIPNRGIGYGLLRYLCPDENIRRQLAARPQPQVNFNYLGQFDQLPTAEWFPFQIAPESVGPEQSHRSLRTVLLHIVAIVTGGEMHLRCLYSKNLHRRETIERLTQDCADELRSLITHCLPTGEATIWNSRPG